MPRKSRLCSRYIILLRSSERFLVIVYDEARGWDKHGYWNDETNSIRKFHHEGDGLYHKNMFIHRFRGDRHFMPMCDFDRRKLEEEYLTKEDKRAFRILERNRANKFYPDKRTTKFWEKGFCMGSRSPP